MIGLSASWSETLDLNGRVAPELITSISDIPASGHADVIRVALSELGISAVFCVDGVPTVAVVESSDIDVQALHRILWSQGVFSVLLVLQGFRALSLSLSAAPAQVKGELDNKLVEQLHQTADAFQLANLFRSIESGRYWMDHESHFRAESRIDQVLLSNLEYAFHQLLSEMDGAASQALLMQTMFISYVEDRGMISPQLFRKASGGAAGSFVDLLELEHPAALGRLFHDLSEAFNGGVFFNPLSLHDKSDFSIGPSVFQVLARFRRGVEVMKSGQFRLWGYDFRYIPIALISAVYDRFLGNESSLRKKHGAFYTPAFLADVVVDQVWEQLPKSSRDQATFMDPACGSGIFLVRLFQRIVAHKKSLGQELSWDSLVSVVERLHGADIDPAAVRITAFSLYIALLEQMDPREIAQLTKRGHILPPLLGKTLHPERDFIKTSPFLVDVILGNPPWKGRPGAAISEDNSASEADPVPALDIAWRFVWQSLNCLKPDGVIGLLLPAMGVLHNPSAAAARQELFARAKVSRVINFSDLVFELFDGADRPTCLFLLAPNPDVGTPYSFDYWVPKADPSLRLKRVIPLPRSDQIRIRSTKVGTDPGLFKRRLWTRSSDEKLFDYLKTFASLGSLITQFKDTRSSDDESEDDAGEWVIGQGFKFALEKEKRPPGYTIHDVPSIADYPFYPARKFRALALNYHDLLPPADTVVHRIGFVKSFDGPHILIPQGVVRNEGRLRAAYGERPISFNSSLQAILFPKNETEKAKLLTAVLNSRLAAWFFFHNSAYLGVDRAKVLQNQLLQLPFDDSINMPNPTASKIAEQRLIELIDAETKHAKYSVGKAPAAVWNTLDRLVAQYYGLDEDDIAVINDTFDYIIPAMQPRLGKPAPKLWNNANALQRAQYSLSLCRSLMRWVKGSVNASLVATSPDYSLLRLTFGCAGDLHYTEENQTDLRDAVARIGVEVGGEISRNLQLVPDLRIAIGNDLYLLKPNRVRNWLQSYAQADADDIAADLLNWSLADNKRTAH